MEKMRYIFLLIAITVFCSCQRKEDVIARVGSENLTVEEFLKEIKEAPDYYLDFLQTESGRRQFVEVLIKEKVMIVAAKDLKIDKTREYKDLLNDFESDYRKQLAEYKNNLLVQEYYRKLKTNEIRVTENEIKRFYRDNEDKYKRPLKITLSHILLSNREKAEKVLEKLKKGVSFRKLASEFTTDFWLDTESGKLEYTQPGSLAPELEDAALSLKTGGFSKPVQSSEGFYIIKKDSQIPQKEISLDEAEANISALLESRKFELLIEDLKQKYAIEINRKNVDKYFRQSAIDKASEEG